MYSEHIGGKAINEIYLKEEYKCCQINICTYRFDTQ